MGEAVSDHYETGQAKPAEVFPLVFCCPGTPEYDILHDDKSGQYEDYLKDLMRDMNHQANTRDGRERLGSRLGFIMLSAGCAIGCGNAWKFPWMKLLFRRVAPALIIFLYVYGLLTFKWR